MNKVAGIFRLQNRTVEQEFLPAALEIIEKPPSPAGRAVIRSVILLFVLAVGWSMIGHVDIVTVASGKLVPSGRIKAIQAAQLGIVRHIHVVEGQAVTAGQLLIELDPSITVAEQVRVTATIASLRSEHRRLRKFIDRLDTGNLSSDDARNSGAVSVAGSELLQDHILGDQWEEYRALHAAFEQEMTANQAEQVGVRINLEKLVAILPLITERAAAMKEVVDKDLAPRMHWNELEQERIEAEKEIGVLKQQQGQLQAQAGQIEQQFLSRQAGIRKTVRTQTVELDRKIADLEQTLVKVETQSQQQRLMAPVSGTVHRMAVHTVGGVIKPAEPLMYIVPDSAGLEVEAWIKNRDIGFIEEGQTARVKIDTFPFTRYGTVEGVVEDLSQDAVADNENGLMYRARILIERSSIQAGRHLVKLVPGMTVTAEVKTGKRRLIEFLLTPLLRYRDEFARER